MVRRSGKKFTQRQHPMREILRWSKLTEAPTWRRESLQWRGGSRRRLVEEHTRMAVTAPVPGTDEVSEGRNAPIYTL
jgi:hypothetical protein